MAYLGPPPSQKLATPTSQYFSGNGSATAFTLNRPVNVAEDLNVFVNNVAQQPGSGKSYTATGTTLTFDAAPDSGTNNVYVVYRGLSEGTLRLEGTTTGIDDNADATAITISSGELVGIGETSPTSALHIKGGAGTNLAIQSTAGTHWRIGDGVGSTNGNLVIYDYTDSRKVFEIDTLGRVTTPSQPSFLVQPNSTQNNIGDTAGTAAVITMDNERYDVGGNFASNAFTAPVTGKYLLSAVIYVSNLDSAATYVAVYIYSSNRIYFQIFDPDFGQDSPYWTFTLSTVADMDANDTVNVRWAQYGGTVQTDINAESSFSGILIG